MNRKTLVKKAESFYDGEVSFLEMMEAINQCPKLVGEAVKRSLDYAVITQNSDEIQKQTTHIALLIGQFLSE